MKKLTIFIFLIINVLEQVKAQDFTADNKLYQTISWVEFCKVNQQDKAIVLIDVRTAGEYADTSSFVGYNQGRIKNSIHIDYFKLDSTYRDFEPYRGKSIYLYCSHSNRSRRIAKNLALKGYTNITNINGGMSILNGLSQKEIPCKTSIYTTKLGYERIGLKDFMQKLKNTNVVILDVRSDSVYQAISSNEEQNSLGRLKVAKHIPLNQLSQKPFTLDINKEYLLIDSEGDESPLAAELLLREGIKKVSVLNGGLFDLHFFSETKFPQKEELLINTVPYNVINIETAFQLTQSQANVFLIDLRPATVFTNKDSVKALNIGRLRHAVNIPFESFDSEYQKLPTDKKTPIVLYESGAMGNNKASKTALKLTKMGFSNISVLQGGIFSVRWVAANINHKEYLWQWIEN